MNGTSSCDDNNSSNNMAFLSVKMVIYGGILSGGRYSRAVLFQ